MAYVATVAARKAMELGFDVIVSDHGSWREKGSSRSEGDLYYTNHPDFGISYPTVWLGRCMQWLTENMPELSKKVGNKVAEQFVDGFLAFPSDVVGAEDSQFIDALDSVYAVKASLMDDTLTIEDSKLLDMKKHIIDVERKVPKTARLHHVNYCYPDFHDLDASKFDSTTVVLEKWGVSNRGVEVIFVEAESDSTSRSLIKYLKNAMNTPLAEQIAERMYVLFKEMADQVSESDRLIYTAALNEWNDKGISPISTAEFLYDLLPVDLGLRVTDNFELPGIYLEDFNIPAGIKGYFLADSRTDDYEKIDDVTDILAIALGLLPVGKLVSGVYRSVSSKFVKKGSKLGAGMAVQFADDIAGSMKQLNQAAQQTLLTSGAGQGSIALSKRMLSTSGDKLMRSNGLSAYKASVTKFWQQIFAKTALIEDPLVRLAAQNAILNEIAMMEATGIYHMKTFGGGKIFTSAKGYLMKPGGLVLKADMLVTDMAGSAGRSATIRRGLGDLFSRDGLAAIQSRLGKWPFALSPAFAAGTVSTAMFFGDTMLDNVIDAMLYPEVLSGLMIGGDMSTRPSNLAPEDIKAMSSLDTEEFEDEVDYGNSFRLLLDSGGIYVETMDEYRKRTGGLGDE
jgi:hypothetical protein